MSKINAKVPYSQEALNLYNASYTPSMLHLRDNELTRYYERYLFQKLLSVFKFEIPEQWDMNYFTTRLFTRGVLAVFETKKYGVIVQECSVSGFNLYYQPASVLVANPLLEKSYMLDIGKECEVIYLNSEYCGIYDIVQYYAQMMALCSESATQNLLNTKLAYVFFTNNKANAESFKKMYDNLANGAPVATVGQELRSDGNGWQMFNQNLKQNFISPDILVELKDWEDKFNTEIGIPNANTNKKERLITDEVNANNVSTNAKVELWLENLKRCFDKVNKKYNLNLKAELRFEGGEEDGNVEYSRIMDEE